MADSTSTSSASSGSTKEAPKASTKSAETPETSKYYVAQDGVSGRDGGPYLDQIEREQGEVLRARAEGRDVDFEKASAVAGTVLVTGGQLTDNVNSNPSMLGVSETTEPKVNEELVATPQELPVDSRASLSEKELEEQAEFSGSPGAAEARAAAEKSE